MVMDALSALMDGELNELDAQREIARLRNDPEARERWESFHVIGDAMRGQSVLSAGFSASLASRFAEEPTVLSPRRLSRQTKRAATYALSAAASLCAVAFVGWVALGPTGLIGPQASVAPLSSGLPVSAQAGAAQPVMAETSVSSDGRMNEYLLAHQGFSPSTAIQGLAPYIRSVSTTRSSDGR
jgi:sigma-E factor negative regulatory protein RseA